MKPPKPPMVVMVATAPGGCRASDHARGQRPEGAHGAPQADGDQRHGNQGDGNVAGAGGPGEAGGGQHHASEEVPAAFVGAVGAAPYDNGKYGSEQVGQRGVAGNEASTGGCRALLREAAQNQRHPQIHDVDADLNDDVDAGQQPHCGHAEGIQQIVMHGCSVKGLVTLQLALKPELLGGREPGDLVGRVLEDEEHGDAEQNGGNAFHQKKPLPTAEAMDAVELEQGAGQGRTHHSCQRGRGHEQGDGTRALVRWEPEGEVEQHARNEACLCHAQQQAHQVEGVRRCHKDHTGRDEAPGDHDAGDPEARADAAQQEGAGQVAERITEKKNTRACAVDRVAEVQLTLDVHGREADIDAVYIGSDVEHKHVRNEAAGDAPVERARVDWHGLEPFGCSFHWTTVQVRGSRGYMRASAARIFCLRWSPQR